MAEGLSHVLNKDDYYNIVRILSNLVSEDCIVEGDQGNLDGFPTHSFHFENHVELPSPH